MPRVTLLVLFVGCGFAASIDTRIHREFQHVSIGASVVVAPEDLSAYEATFLQPDASAPDGLVRIPAEHVDSGWVADLDDALPLQFTLPDFPTPIVRFSDFPQRRLTSVFAVLEHPAPQLAPMGSMISLDVSLDRALQGGEALIAYVVGSWSSFAIPTATITFPHESMVSLSGRPHSAFTRDDAMFVLRTDGRAVTGVAAIAPFDEATTNALVGTMVPVVQDQRLAVQIDRDVATTRLLGATPALSSINAAWSLTAAPGAAYAQSTGPALGSGTLGPGATVLDAAYGNPFADRGWPALLFWQAYGSRVVQTRLLPVTLVGGIYEYRTAAAGGTSALPAGLPQAVTFDGMPLTADNLMLARPTRPVEIKFLSDRPENTGVYSLALYELVPNIPATALTYKTIASFSGTEPRFLVPPELFVPDHLYVFRAVTSTGGYDIESFASGDLTKRVLPFAVGYFDAGVFEVH